MVEQHLVGNLNDTKKPVKSRAILDVTAQEVTVPASNDNVPGIYHSRPEKQIRIPILIDECEKFLRKGACAPRACLICRLQT